MLDSRMLFACYLLFLCVGFGYNFGLLVTAQKTKPLLETNQNEDSHYSDESDKRVLNMFGFKKRPKPTKDVHIPKIMQHLYKSHMGDEFDGQQNLLDVWEKGLHLPSDDVTRRVNTARSFHHIYEDEHLPGMPDHHIRLRFNLSSLPPDEVVGASDLFLHREAVQSHMLTGRSHLHRINVYQIIKLPEFDPERGLHLGGRWKTNSPEGSYSGAITRLIDTRVVDTGNNTWEKFDVSLATMNWAHQPHEENHGLLVEIVDAHDGKPPEAEEKKHVRLKRDLHDELDDAEWKDKKPTLVTYTQDKMKTNLRRRGPRSRRNSRKKENNSSRRKKKRKRRPCARHNLYVDFGEVGWREWIVAPHGYDAFYCHGQCLFPLAEHLNATNHAIVQTLTNSVHPSIVPNPCCVPTELTSISMLYVDEHNLVVLKSYPKMAVEACGCR